MVKVLTEWQDWGVIVPGAVLWALALNEGDPVAAERKEGTKIRVWKAGWGERELAMGPAGKLDLEPIGTASPLVRGEPLLLVSESYTWDASFTLEPAAGSSRRERLSAQAFYRLQVAPEHRVILPEDALWALGLSEGQKVSCEAVMSTLKGGEPPERLRDGGRLQLQGRALPLPEKLRREPRLQPGSPVRFEVNIAGPLAWFRLEPDLSDELARREP
jgi:hypothetical protein